MRVTAYCACRKCCGRFADGRTACGYKIQAGDYFVAADRSLPFGTEVIVPGYNANKPVKVVIPRTRIAIVVSLFLIEPVFHKLC